MQSLFRGRSPFVQTLVFTLSLIYLSLPISTRAQTLKITSNPPGATVEIDGVPEGTTPFEKKYPGGTVMGKRLEHPMKARILLSGYAPRELTLTEGPMQWNDLHGHNRGQYYLFQEDHFHIELESVASVDSKLSVAELVSRSKPAVVCLSAAAVHRGSGFFVTASGLIVTNVHVVREDQFLTAQLPDGTLLTANVIWVDPKLDIALLKAALPLLEFQVPHLSFANSDSVRQGETVLAIGNPGYSMPFSVTKGIVSAVGENSDIGPGIWIQTDATINPGNSGGPLLNLRGQVIGVNTQKVNEQGFSGIAYARSSNELVGIVRRLYPTLNVQSVTNPAATGEDAVSKQSLPAEGSTTSVESSSFKPTSSGFGTLSITADPEDAELYVDGKFVGNTPATLKLSAGTHNIVLKSSGYADYSRTIEILASSKLTLNATLTKEHETE